MEDARSVHMRVLLFLFQACGDPALRPDAGHADAAGDAGGLGDASGAGDAEADGGTGGEWGFCPSSADAVADAAWSYAITVTGEAVLCSYAFGSLDDGIRNARRIRFVPGTYPFPDVAGQYSFLIPACGVDRDGRQTVTSAPGTLDLRIDPLIGLLNRQYRIETPFGDGSIRADISLWDRTSEGMPIPELILDANPSHGTFPDYEVMYLACPSTGCTGVEQLWPCPAPGSGQASSITFDRGRLDVATYLFPAFGPSRPAALTRATGMIDGVAFEEDDYFQLAHRPDHHNRGGAYLVVFDQPIAGACGIEAQIPSSDGSFWIDRPAAWLIGCDLVEIEELSGVTGG
jgi:hypothetical protein